MKHLTIIISAAALLGAAACTDLTEVNNKLDSLDSRVSALEKSLTAINSNVNALAALAANQTINSVEQDGDTWLLTLSNGTVLTISQGSIGVGNTPVLSIDSDGYWQVDYGNGPEPVLQNGRPVYAIGEDGVTPIFGVSEDNYWIVSYDGGSTWQDVLYSAGDHAGERVKAYDAGSGDSYFHNVEYDEDGGVFVLTLKTGQVFTVPVVKDFLCQIYGVDDVQTFDYGQTRTFTVIMSGVADYTVIVPNGWAAVVQGEGSLILAVTAPAAQTKATIADSETDISIVAFTSSGLSTSAKMQVGLSGKTYTVTPYTSPTSLQVGSNDAQVRVLVENADKWYYLLSTSSTAPHAVEIATDGVEGSSSIFTLDGLKQDMTYWLYTTAERGGSFGDVSGCSFTTSITDDRYEAFMAGEDVVICGVRYNKTDFADIYNLTATASHDTQLGSAFSGGGIFFLETPEGTSFALGEVKNSKPVVLVGRYASKRAHVIQFSNGRLRLNKGVAMCYIFYDSSERSDITLMFDADNITVPFVHFDDCRLNPAAGKTWMYGNFTGIVLDSFRIESCDVLISDPPESSLVTEAIIHLSWKSIASMSEAVFDNNIFYSAYDTRLNLIKDSENFDSDNPPSVKFKTKVQVTANTFYGCGSDWAGIRCYLPQSVTVRRNIFWQSAARKITTCVVADVYGTDDAAAPAVDCGDNLGYRTDVRCLGGTTPSVYVPGDNISTSLAADPFASIDPDAWKFTPVTAYSKYGAQR